MSKVFTRYRTLFIAIFLAGLTFVTLWGVLKCDFINYGDDLHVYANPSVLAGLTGESIRWAFTTFYEAFWMPLVWLSWMLDQQVYGLNPLGYHLTNLLFHIANVVLLFYVLRRMTKSTWRSALVAALFAVHPLHVESVAWVTERKDVLSTFFWMLTMGAYTLYAERPAIKRYLLVLLFFALGLMSKSALITLPIVLLLMDYWPLGRFGNQEKQQGRILRLILEKVPLLALATVSGILSIAARSSNGSVASLDLLPMTLRIKNALVSYIAYLVKTIWPTKLAVFYPHLRNELPMWQVVVSFLLLASLTYLALKSWRKRPYLTVGWLWYLGTLMPMIGIIQVGTFAMADRFTYVPLIGVFIAVVWAIPELTTQRAKSVVCVISGIAVLMLSVLAWRQTGYWRNSESLFRHALQVTTNNYVAEARLGVALTSKGNLNEAFQHFDEAMRFDPNPSEARLYRADALGAAGGLDDAIMEYEDVLLNDEAAFGSSPRGIRNRYMAHIRVGSLLERKGDFDAAVQHFEDAIHLDRNMPEAPMKTAEALVMQGKTDQAIRKYEQIMRNNQTVPDKLQNRRSSYMAQVNLGALMESEGKPAEAVAHYEKAIRLERNPLEARMNMAALLRTSGKTDEAIKQYELILRANPKSAATYCSLASALEARKKPKEAVKAYRRGLAADPSSEEARSGLVQGLCRLDKVAEAAQVCRDAVRLDPKSASAHYNLGVVLGMQRKADESIEAFRAAIRLKPDYAKAHKNLAVALYFKGEYAAAWAEVHVCRKRAIALHPGFIQALSQKMPDRGR